MIYTITLNPSLDYIMKLDNFVSAGVTRSTEEKIFIGGKGINVSTILRELGVKSKALGFISGFTGEYIVNVLNKKNIDTDFINVENGFTRINVKIKSNVESEINGAGPLVASEYVDGLISKLTQLTSKDVLVIAGSIPQSIPNNIYKQILSIVSQANVKVVLDTTKLLLIEALEHKPFLIKPNKHELEEIFDIKIESLEDVIFYAKKLQSMGAINVIISLGGEGAILVCQTGHVYKTNVPKGVVKNSVGAGDSMVAGFIATYLETQDYKLALRKGASCGSATAFSHDLATIDFIEEIENQIVVETL
ncbi:1-phosphofructokinase [Candidatus Epulonipiscium fishelsonii]|uniref:1-phosphofructokinase n=1 Tax=Candidatus Epulonipiscium fishelsonii TaxID=77094 RepID=A0ACC8X9X7_9FIRM|nr:1-phosphofructokinase [Epulopiscium sp. SCG-D08WGA-EpuloA1]